MPTDLDFTHDPALASWVASANTADTDFPIQNLPYGRFHPRSEPGDWRIGVAIGDQVLDLRRARQAGGWPPEVATLLEPLAAGELAPLMASVPAVRRALRQAFSRALAAGSAQQPALAPALLPQAEAVLGLPCRIGDYTDFYTGIHHATAVGRLFRPDNPLLPNYKWVPIGYHGRSSSLVPSGTPVRRPQGQLMPPGETIPGVGPCKRLDYELELGALVGRPNALGEPVPLAEAESRLFGLLLLNDWSARDVQAWEYQPLGPFLSKSFASTLSPWVVTLEALAPFRAPFERAAGEPQPLPYLDGPANRAAGAFDIGLEVWLQSDAMRAAGLAPQCLSRSNFTDA
jgi:fumarylacetoacetase